MSLLPQAQCNHILKFSTSVVCTFERNLCLGIILGENYTINTLLMKNNTGGCFQMPGDFFQIVSLLWVVEK